MSFDTAEVRYANSGEVRVAYRVFGAGPFDVVFVSGLTSSLDAGFWLPEEVEEFEMLGAMARCLIFDKRGTGISDRGIGAPSLEERMDDVRAVMDSADCHQAVIYGRRDGGAMSALFAAAYPERTVALILANPQPRFTSTPDFPWAPTRDEYDRRTDEDARTWGTRQQAFAIAANAGLEQDEETLTALARRMRLAASPGAVRALRKMNAEIDVRSVLPSVQAPTLVLTYPTDAELGRYVAERIPDAEQTESERARLPDIEPTLTAFLARARTDWANRASEPERVLATVLFTDIVDSTQKALELGPRWPELLHEHNLRIRRELARYRGREIDTAGDGFFASGFDGPARAIRCACAIRDSIRDLGLQIRVGLHTGECDLVDGKLAGLAVVVGARIAGEANQGDVLVSGTVRDLVAGSGIEFEPRGTHQLKGVGDWPLFAVRP